MRRNQMILLRIILFCLLIVGLAGAFNILISYDYVPAPIAMFPLSTSVFAIIMLRKGSKKSELISIENGQLLVRKNQLGKVTVQSFDIAKISGLRPTFNPRKDLPHYEFRSTIWNIPEGRIVFNYKNEEVESEIKLASLIDYEDAPYLIKALKNFKELQERNFA
ncbi:MAG: hypothetical protein ACYC1Q_09515 [Bacteroidia bacterium]